MVSVNCVQQAFVLARATNLRKFTVPLKPMRAYLQRRDASWRLVIHNQLMLVGNLGDVLDRARLELGTVTLLVWDCDTRRFDSERVTDGSDDDEYREAS